MGSGEKYTACLQRIIWRWDGRKNEVVAHPYHLGVFQLLINPKMALVKD